MLVAFFLQCMLAAAAVCAAIDPEAFDQALKKLSVLAQKAIDDDGVPGLAIAVVYNGSVQYAEGFGVKLVGTNDTVDADTVFQLASFSKPISSTIVAAIISTSNLTWDTHINTPNTTAAYSDPWISSEVTIADGFSHRSGLYGLAGDDLEIHGFQRDTILSRLQYLQPFGPFRASYSYSNYGITAAAVAASNYISAEWEDAAQTYLYEPLGMTSTSSRYSDFLSRTNRAALHFPSANSTNSTDPTAWQPAYPRNPDPQSPAGGVSSSVNDLTKWLQLQLAVGLYEGQQFITPEALNATHRPHIVRGLTPTTQATGYYGLGWNVDYDDRSARVYIDHAGAFSQGARTLTKLSIEDGLGIVVLANCFPTGWPEGLADSFFDWALYGEVSRDWVGFWNGEYAQLNALLGAGAGEFAGSPPTGSASLGDGAYVGRYVNDYVGVVEVSASGEGNGTSGGGGGLVLSLPGGSNRTYPLTHWDRDTFVMDSAPDEPGTGVSFTIGADGNATAVTVESLNGYGLGVLIRDVEGSG